MEFTFRKGCYIFLKMIKNINREIMNLLAYVHYLNNLIFVKFDYFYELLILLTKKLLSERAEIVNRQDLKSCGW